MKTTECEMKKPTWRATAASCLNRRGTLNATRVRNRAAGAASPSPRAACALPPELRARFVRRNDRRPLVHLHAAMRDLDMTAGEVRTLLDLGFLAGFNIAVRAPERAGEVGPGGRRETFRPELRVLTRSLEQFRGAKTKRPFEMPLPEMLGLILPPDRSILLGKDVQHCLNCDRGHVENLIRAGHLDVLKESRPGPGGSWMISRWSLEAFLEKRRY